LLNFPHYGEPTRTRRGRPDRPLGRRGRSPAPLHDAREGS
jgi:hypothetical protein